jgi:arabinan endo-1,5-alpha-L-arabinosidase
VPKWVRKELGFAPPNIWAPSITKHGDMYYLYYSLSVFGVNTSALGLMTNPALDPKAPGEGWTDQGIVLKSGGRDNWNAIDPRRIDTADGKAWLSYGSYWDGIKMRELDPVSGMPANETVYDLASRQGGGIEASAIFEHEGKFYLFVSFDQCCKQLESTYRIMVGRADAVTGPYVDRDGKAMLQGAATEVQAGQGRFIGPGGQEAISSSMGDLLVYHYYDGDDLGVSKLEISPIEWDEEGWPVLPAVPQ